MAIVRKGASGPKTRSFALPSKPNTPPTNLLEYCIFIYGQKGAGKSSLASALGGPNSVTLMFEPGRKNLPIRQLPQKGEAQLDWEATVGYANEMIDRKEKGPLIVDTADRAYEACLQHVSRQYNVDHPSDLNDYGKCWSAVKEEFTTLWTRCLFAGLPVIFTSHAKKRSDEYFDDTYESDFIAPTCSPQCWGVLKAMCDFAFYLGYHKKQRMLVVRGSEEVWAASGVDDHFLDSKTKEPYHAFLLGDINAKLAAQNLLAAYDNKVRGLGSEESEQKSDKPTFKRK